MKIQNVVLTLLILFASFQICFGQEKSKAELIDEFGKLNCEDFWARFDNFTLELQNDLTSTGYIIIHGEKNSLSSGLGYEKLTDGLVRFKNLDRSRLIIIRGAEEESVHIQFWKVPAGAEAPTFTAGNWNLTVNQNKPFILRGYSDGNGICPTNTSVKLFADYLKANPNMRAHVVISGKFKSMFTTTEKDLLNHLVSEHGISPNRLKFFNVRDKTADGNFAGIEYWLVPNKKK